MICCSNEDFNSGVYSSIVKGEATGQIHLDGILETAFECSCYLIFFLWKFYTVVNLSLPAINQKHSCYITPRIDYCENDSITPKVAGSRHQMKKIALHESRHKKSTLGPRQFAVPGHHKGGKCHTVSLNEYRCIQE